MPLLSRVDGGASLRAGLGNEFSGQIVDNISEFEYIPASGGRLRSGTLTFMIPRFSLRRPTTLDAAFDAFSSADGDASYYAGGTELLQVMKMGLAQFDTLIDLKGVDELRGIRVGDDGTIRIGAACTHREIERSAEVLDHLPALVGLEQHVANTRVRNTGTIGGNLAFAEPHSDPATFLLACSATIELAGPGGQRETGIPDFVVGPLTTDRAPEEVVVAIQIPPRQRGEGRGYAKIAFFERPAASVAVRLRVEDGAIASAVVAIGSMTELPMLAETAATALIGGPAEADALAAHLRDLDVFGDVEIVDDLNGSVDYKRHLAGVLLARAARAALDEAVSDV
jgi:carbon-monoxide dehydrogenase medium subunit